MTDNQDKYVTTMKIWDNTKDSQDQERLDDLWISKEDHEKSIAVNRSEVYDEMNKLIQEKDKEHENELKAYYYDTKNKCDTYIIKMKEDHEKEIQRLRFVINKIEDNFKEWETLDFGTYEEIKELSKK